MTTMQVYLSILLVFLLFSGNFGASVYPKSCKIDKNCPVPKRFCALCIRGNGPACTTPICVNNRCGVIKACSLKVSGTCSVDGDCITHPLCETCKTNTGPFCAQARCLGGQCATIAPCSIQLWSYHVVKHWGHLKLHLILSRLTFLVILYNLDSQL